ncbi:Uncharacterised protein [Mycobacteroides abscessus subsp. abscessus]|nr:Uncharacterised protein [Mycobacteroides abscessus subsp. abscessus]
MCAPSSSPVSASKIVLTKPSASPIANALPFACRSKCPTRSVRPVPVHCFSVRPRLATCGRAYVHPGT